MTDDIHELAKRVADTYAEIVDWRTDVNEKREALSAAQAGLQKAETDLLNARAALDKATGVVSGFLGESFVDDAPLASPSSDMIGYK